MQELLPIVLDIDIINENSFTDDGHLSFLRSRLHDGWFVDLTLWANGMFTVDAVSDSALTFTYREVTHTLALGEEWKLPSYPISVRYYRLTAREHITRLLERILPIHKKSLHALILSTTDDEQLVLQLINHEIDAGSIGLYPLKALLISSNNWYTTKILRQGMFREILLEGIAKGSLSPCDAEGWEWLHVAADTNDPAEFMTDMERYYDLLASAAEAGNIDALDIMNEIWPPEQIIEED